MNHKERAERRIKIAEFAAVHGTAKAALEFSVSHQLVTQCLKSHGMRGNDRLTVKVSSFEILRKLLDGQSGSEIAREHNVSRQFVDIVKRRAQAAGFSFTKHVVIDN